MNRSSNGRIFRIAIAASIAIHLAIASVVHHSPPISANEPETHPLVIRHFVKPKPVPTPTPKPQVQPHTPVKRTQTVRPPMHPPHLPPDVSTKGPSQVAYTPGPVGTPVVNDGGDATSAPATSAPSAPTPTPKPACSAPDVPAKAIDAIAPETPPDSPEATAIAKVKVDLDASGAVTNAAIFESTGYAQLDRAAIEAARESRYAPEEKDCKNVAGSYLFDVYFQQ